jgi:hypothetical protein
LDHVSLIRILVTRGYLIGPRTCENRSSTISVKGAAVQKISSAYSRSVACHEKTPSLWKGSFRFGELTKRKIVHHWVRPCFQSKRKYGFAA